MAVASGARWIPLSSGGMVLVDNNGTTLITLSAAGAMTFQAAVTVGALRVQNMTGAERDAINSPAAGTIIYNTTTNKLNVRAAAAWEAVTSA